MFLGIVYRRICMGICVILSHRRRLSLVSIYRIFPLVGRIAIDIAILKDLFTLCLQAILYK